MSALMSFRYFGQHYTIYPDFFYIASIGTSSASVWRTMIAAQPQKSRTLAFGGALILLVAYGLLNFQYAKREYPKYAESIRNQIESIPAGVWVAPEYAQKMSSRYGTPEQIIKRVATDARLNGVERGIDIMSLPNVRQQMSKLN